MNSTNPKIIFIVVISMAIFTMTGFVGTFLLILWKADAALIAILSGFTGTALGQLGSILNNTRTQPASDTLPIKTEVTNTAANPVPTTDQ